MINMLLIKLVEMIIGLASGLAVGSGFVAFLMVLGIVPRLIQLSRSMKLINLYGPCVIAGSLFGVYLSFTATTWNQPLLVLAIWGVFHGIFVGMLAAALTEVLNVFPILSKRIGVDKQLLWLLMAIVFGKIGGSLFQWTFFVK
ncbi:stage V sporulation protein AB [Virgibacillus phasianinus]|uniref:Stage V sporulation protein AB n=1 Tax=Virgibacillus phasianinus TaxID=2017483 RepID=A0A220U5N5_9BACI|nr:stage V sporulation protein AB [Virgibacillus phasianinus]ASK63292.1 stage V sporulation protein AB [Virgibacillus phasianinus]